jgi:hypothetical protein
LEALLVSTCRRNNVIVSMMELAEVGPPLFYGR